MHFAFRRGVEPRPKYSQVKGINGTFVHCIQPGGGFGGNFFWRKNSGESKRNDRLGGRIKTPQTEKKEERNGIQSLSRCLALFFY